MDHLKNLAVTIPEFAMPDLLSRLLYREHYVVAVRPQHPLARRTALTAERLCNYDHVLVSPTGGSFEGPTNQALARLRLRRKVGYSVPSFLLMPEILETDDLVAVVPSRLLCENTTSRSQVSCRSAGLRCDRRVASARRQGYCPSMGVIA